MAAQNEVQSKERAVLERHQNEACASSIKGYMRSLFLLAIIGIIGFGYMLYAHPTLIFTQRSARLVDRRIMTIYPVALHIKCNLPHFFDSYAIVTPEHHVGNSHRIGQGRDGAVARSRSHIDSPGLEARGGSRLGKVGAGSLYSIDSQWTHAGVETMLHSLNSWHPTARRCKIYGSRREM
jgi:hypothetical protein